MQLQTINLLSLACIGCIDFVKYKVPNVLLAGWIVTILFFKKFDSTITNYMTPASLIASLLVATSFIPLRHIVKCNAGDFKLYGVLTAIVGANSALKVLFITNIISIFPLTSGIKKVPIGFITFFVYVALVILKI